MSVTKNTSTVSESQCNKLNCPDPYSVVMDAMRHVSLVSGPAMDMRGYRAYMDAMKIFSLATKEILERNRLLGYKAHFLVDDEELDEPNVGDPPPPSDHEKRSLR